VSESATDRELIEALGGRIDGHEIVGLERRPYRYATSASLEELVVTTRDGGRTTLILKDLSRERLLGDARSTKPEFLHEPRRELETYRRILGPAGVGPRCIGAVSRSDPERHWLFIEKVEGVELWQVGELSVWEHVAGWVGGFHAGFAGRVDELRSANPHLLEHSEAWFRSWHERASEALAQSTDDRAPALARALERYGEVAEALAALPRTFVHGELYPSNVIVVRDGDPLGVYPVDWEMAAIGSGLIDLAALSGGWAAAERRRLEEAYGAGLVGAGGSLPDSHELEASLARCRLQLALQWLGWSADWAPPPEHAHDWLGEALALAGELKLR